jgi:hypothetical protein
MAYKRILVPCDGSRTSTKLLGSGAESVIRLSTLPVLVVRGEDDDIGS